MGESYQETDNELTEPLNVDLYQDKGNKRNKIRKTVIYDNQYMLLILYN